MGTRGTYGIRKNGEDKLAYNHWDSYPDYLGHQMLKFCNTMSFEELHKFYDKLELIDEQSKPTQEQIDICKALGFADFSVSTRKEDDWYCLLRGLQGELDKYTELVRNENIPVIYMAEANDFIKDSLFCEYGYIINLDDEVLELWVGWQDKPDETNRYGTKKYEGYSSDYYPCKLVATYPLNEIYNCSEQQLMNLVDDMELKCGNN